MTLAAGTPLGPYEVVTPIGAGGMGEVYRARDPRLNREVAIKVSAAQFSDRFEREAKAIAALNHPNICHLYDVGPNYLVMELVEGPTLAERIKEGRLPIEEALAIASQIAEALEAAHEKGIYHRDLKPGNVKIRPDGTVKVLDFGLAKLGGTLTLGSDNSPTITMAQTEAGMILGTAAYMSPEQAKGKPVDQRTDIYAFGAVVYEMVTGERVHRGETTTEILASVIKEEPRLDNVPAQVRRMLQKCLQKDPHKRLRHIGDVMALVDEVPVSAPPVLDSAAARSPRRNWSLAGWVAAGVLAVVAASFAWYLKPAPPKQVSRFAMSLPAGQKVFPVRPDIAISRDGTRLVYSAGPTLTATQLYLRAMDGLEAHPIPGTESAYGPFFSPDGQWVGFNQVGKLKKISLNGGPPVILADTSPLAGALGASWGDQGTIAFSPRTNSPIQQVSEAGGGAQALSRLDKGASQVFPELLPGGAGILFSVGTTQNTARIVGQPLKTGESRDLFQGGVLARYAPSGHIIFMQGLNLMAAPFDSRGLKTTGTPVPVIEGVLPLQYSFSWTGTLVYIPGSSQAAQLRLVWVDRKGTEQPLPAPLHNYVMPRLSPDGRTVAAGLEEADGQVWLYDLARDTLTRLTFAQGDNVDPVWTPDGKRIVFKGKDNRLFWQAADGSSAAEALTDGNLSSNDIPGSFSPDGQAMAIVQSVPTQSVWILSLRERKSQVFERGETNETAPRFSPDGHWIAYTSSESGRPEIYVRPYPGPGGKYQISTEGGTEPMWNPKGRELFYRAGNKMMAVNATMQSGFSPGKPRILFEGTYAPSPRSAPNYDVSPDGQRFLMLKATEQALAPTQINVVLNWFEELGRRVPSGSR